MSGATSERDLEEQSFLAPPRPHLVGSPVLASPPCPCPAPEPRVDVGSREQGQHTARHGGQLAAGPVGPQGPDGDLENNGRAQQLQRAAQGPPQLPGPRDGGPPRWARPGRAAALPHPPPPCAGTAATDVSPGWAGLSAIPPSPPSTTGSCAPRRQVVCPQALPASIPCPVSPTPRPLCQPHGYGVPTPPQMAVGSPCHHGGPVSWQGVDGRWPLQREPWPVAAVARLQRGGCPRGLPQQGGVRGRGQSGCGRGEGDSAAFPALKFNGSCSILLRRR